MKTYYTYIITNYTNSALYSGVTNNLEKKITEHRQGDLIGSLNKRYRLYKLIWFQEFSNAIEAIEAEKKIKGWIREKKLQLIKTTNPKLKDLSTYA